MNLDAAHAPQDWKSRKLHLLTQPFALALANSAVPTVLADATMDDHPIVFANASFLRLTGCEEDEVLGRNLRFLNAIDADAAAVRRIEEGVVAGEVVSTDLRLSRPDGRSFWVRMDSAPMFGPDGRAWMFVVTLVDVSDRVKATSRLSEAEERFERRVEERTAELKSALAETELLSREITHRTKNALAILAALIAAKRRRATDPREAAVLAEILGRVRAVGRLQGLLDGVGSEQNGIDLAEFLGALVEELEAASEASVVLGEAPHVKLASSAALAIALCVTELVLNAQKHGFTDGRPGVIVLGARADDREMSVTVSDNGVGLPEGFEPRTSPGLGMLVVQDQVEKLHGRLEVGRSPAGGACFAVAFAR